MRSRPSTRALAALLAFSAFTIWITWLAKAIEVGERWRAPVSRLQGKPAPDFTLPTLDGHTVSLADYKGKRVVLTFWASWCGPCRMELPGRAKFYQQVRKPDVDFEILAISIDRTKEDAADAAKELKIQFPVALDLQSRVADSYGVDAIPTLFLIDKDGKVAFSQTGYKMTETILATQLGIKDYSPVAGEKK